MKQKVAVGIVAVALLAGSGTGLAVRELRSDAAEPVASDTAPASPTPSATPTPTPSASSEAPAPESQPQASTAPSKPSLLPLDQMQINTGAVGPVSVGMTKQQAAATGYFKVDVPSDACEGDRPLEWTSNYFNALDVLTTPEGKIVSIGVTNPGPRTRSGLAINSTYAAAKQVLGAKAQPQDAGYGQTGLFVNDGDAWIGFLFDATPGSIQSGESVTFIEVSRGAKPGLIRDGC